MIEKNGLKVVNVRLAEGQSLYSSIPIHSTQDAVDMLGKEIRQYDREVLCVLNIDTKGRVLNMHMASMGTLNSSLAAGREVFKASILSNAASIILMHNHPSGDVTPSRQDIEVTRKLNLCGQLLGIEVLDHIIVGGDDCCSFQENDLMSAPDVRQLLYEKRTPARKEMKLRI